MSAVGAEAVAAVANMVEAALAAGAIDEHDDEGSAKVTREHLDRLAVVYVRQSTLAQVRDHGASTLRQYALTEDAERLGWPADRILVIDADLGVSGRGGSARTGFEELVGRVCCGEVGASSAWRCRGWRARARTCSGCWSCAA